MAQQSLSQKGRTDLLKLLLTKEAKLAERSLYYFVRAVWHLLEPGRKFKDNWHIRMICNHLEACYRGDINRLIINIPYRSMKSTIVSVCFPVWVWLQDPSKHFLTGSHKEKLATRDAIKSRGIIDSPWFKERWPDRIVLVSDQNEKTRYKTNMTGERVIFGTSSGVSGENADFVIIDDAHSAKKAITSKADRESVLVNFDQEVSNRLNDQTGCIIIIMQRLHVNDLSGHCLKDNKDPTKANRWEFVRIPFKYEVKYPCVTCLGNVDPRTKEGDLYWPERFNEGYYEEACERLGSYGVACQLQQRPAPAGGGMCKGSWFPKYREFPDISLWQEVTQFWDTAAKDNELVNSPWVCLTRVKTEKGYFIKDVYCNWHNYPDGKRAVISLAMREKPNAVVIENKSTGQALLKDLPDDPEGSKYSWMGFEPEGDKLGRFSFESPALESGKYHLPEYAPWLVDYLEELESLPNSALMDRADVTSMMCKWDRTRSEVSSVEWI